MSNCYTRYNQYCSVLQCLPHITLLVFCVVPCHVCSVYPKSPYQCSVLYPAMFAVFTPHHPTSVLCCAMFCLPHITLPCHVCSVYPTSPYQCLVFCVVPHVCSVYPTSPYQCSVLYPAMFAVFTPHLPTSVLCCTLPCLQCLPHITLPVFCIVPRHVCSVYPTSPYQCSVLYPAMFAVFTPHHPTSVLCCTLPCLQCLPQITLPVFCVVPRHVCSVYPTSPYQCSVLYPAMFAVFIPHHPTSVVPCQEHTVYPTQHHSMGTKRVDIFPLSTPHYLYPHVQSGV